MVPPRASLEEALGYPFRNRDLLERALTHRSFAQEAQRPGKDNERLEFLGDSVLGFLVSDGLMKRFPGYSEGQLTKVKAYLVRAANLGEVAASLALGDHLRLGQCELGSGGRTKRGLLADGLEAVLAAIYLDGGLEAARRFVERRILSAEALAAAEEDSPLENYRSELQERLQAQALPPPEYRVLEETGPPHRRTFTVEVLLGDAFSASGEGSTKKAASQAAARRALRHLESHGAEASTGTG